MYVIPEKIQPGSHKKNHLLHSSLKTLIDWFIFKPGCTKKEVPPVG